MPSGTCRSFNDGICNGLHAFELSLQVGKANICLLHTDGCKKVRMMSNY